MDTLLPFEEALIAQKVKHLVLVLRSHKGGPRTDIGRVRAVGDELERSS